MLTMEKSDLSELFSRIEDPRIGENFRYPLNEIIFLAMAANLSGVESWRGIELFGIERLDSLRNYFPFVFGIPSSLTLSRVFSLINPIGSSILTVLTVMLSHKVLHYFGSLS